jgi:hypothetical protein
LLGHYRSKITDGHVLRLTCIDPSCSRRIPDDEIKSLIQEDGALLEKYEKFKVVAELRENPNVRWCPAPDCETPLFGNAKNPRLACTRAGCKTVICFNCSQHWHGRAPCEQAIDSMYADWAKGKDIQNCPRCRARIEKV